MPITVRGTGHTEAVIVSRGLLFGKGGRLGDGHCQCGDKLSVVWASMGGTRMSYLEKAFWRK